ncbi:MAG: hypothetical protein WCO84_04290 [bacterium]
MMLAVVMFPAFEPGFASALTSDVKTVVTRQQVTSEISIALSSTAVTMLPAIPGLTGGVGTGSTIATVITNNYAGFTVNTTSSSTAGDMIGEVTGNKISAVAATPATWAVSADNTGFGMAITTDSANVASPAIYASKNSGTDFGAVKDATIMKRTTATDADGETATLDFKAEVKATHTLPVGQDWYTATTTLTATMN